MCHGGNPYLTWTQYIDSSDIYRYIVAIPRQDVKHVPLPGRVAGIFLKQFLLYPVILAAFSPKVNLSYLSTHISYLKIPTVVGAQNTLLGGRTTKLRECGNLSFLVNSLWAKIVHLKKKKGVPQTDPTNRKLFRNQQSPLNVMSTGSVKWTYVSVWGTKVSICWIHSGIRLKEKSEDISCLSDSSSTPIRLWEIIFCWRKTIFR